MSRQQVGEIVAQANGDGAFRQSLLQDPDAALRPFEDKLTAAEKRALRVLRANPLELAALMGRDQVPDASRNSRRPDSFREVGAGALSLALTVAFLLVLVAVLLNIGASPKTVRVGGSDQVIDQFSRAKDLLSVVVPLFGAVITFWLGVAVEGRRADQNKQAADAARSESDNAKESERRKTTVAATALAEVGQAIKALGDEAGEGERGGPIGEAEGERGGPVAVDEGERSGVLGPAPGGRRGLPELQELIDQARRRVEG